MLGLAFWCDIPLFCGGGGVVVLVWLGLQAKPVLGFRPGGWGIRGLEL